MNWGGWEKTAVKIKERGVERTQGQAAGDWGDVIIGLLGTMLLEKMRYGRKWVSRVGSPEAEICPKRRGVGRRLG